MRRWSRYLEGTCFACCPPKRCPCHRDECNGTCGTSRRYTQLRWSRFVLRLECIGRLDAGNSCCYDDRVGSFLWLCVTLKWWLLIMRNGCYEKTSSTNLLARRRGHSIARACVPVSSVTGEFFRSCSIAELSCACLRTSLTGPAVCQGGWKQSVAVVVDIKYLSFPKAICIHNLVT